VQAPPKQASVYVQPWTSSQATPVRQAHVPPALVQEYVTPPQLTASHKEWAVAVQSCVAPPVHSPTAAAGPQPTQTSPTTSRFVSHVSAHSPVSVKHPDATSQAPVQHWLPDPGSQAVGE
jgi:hypothetical protein